jgi:DNA-binding GntR family transcriptional regulator
MARVRRESASDSVYKLLRADIIEGHYAPLQRLYEPELAAILNISRTPLREALRKLEADGFVDKLPTGGMRVAGIDAGDVADLYQIRSLLEGLVAKQAAERATPEDIDKLRAVVSQMKLLTAYPDEVIRLGAQFHGLLAQIAQNPRCDELVGQIRRHLQRYWALTVFSDTPRRAEAIDEHTIVVDAIASGDGDRAELTMRQHSLAGADNVVLGVRRHLERLAAQATHAS